MCRECDSSVRYKVGGGVIKINTRLESRYSASRRSEGKRRGGKGREGMEEGRGRAITRNEKEASEVGSRRVRVSRRGKRGKRGTRVKWRGYILVYGI